MAISIAPTIVIANGEIGQVRGTSGGWHPTLRCQPASERSSVAADAVWVAPSGVSRWLRGVVSGIEHVRMLRGPAPRLGAQHCTLFLVPRSPRRAVLTLLVTAWTLLRIHALCCLDHAFPYPILRQEHTVAPCLLAHRHAHGQSPPAAADAQPLPPRHPPTLPIACSQSRRPTYRRLGHPTRPPKSAVKAQAISQAHACG